MKTTKIIKSFELSEIELGEKPKEITEIFNGKRESLVNSSFAVAETKNPKITGTNR